MKKTLGLVAGLSLVGAIVTPLSLHAAVPPNDLFRNRIRLEGAEIGSTGSNVGATRESLEPPHNGGASGRSVWWSWTASESGFLTVSTEGSSFDTVIAIYTGETLATLIQVAADDDTGPNLTSRATFRAEGGRTYQIGVDGYAAVDIVDSGTIRISLAFASQYLAPTWSLKDIDGQVFSSTNYAGQVVLVNFWATWCGPCIAEMPGLINLQNRYRGRGFAIVGISVDEGGPNVVRPFIPRQKLNYQVLMTNSRVESDFGGIEYIPTSFLVDREGNLIDKFVGYTSESDFEIKIMPLLAPVDPPRATIESREGKLIVAWPIEQTGVAIESSESVTGPWVATAISGVATNGHFEAEISASRDRGFFRLRR